MDATWENVGKATDEAAELVVKRLVEIGLKPVEDLAEKLKDKLAGVLYDEIYVWSFDKVEIEGAPYSK